MAIFWEGVDTHSKAGRLKTSMLDVPYGSRYSPTVNTTVKGSVYPKSVQNMTRQSC